MPLFVMNKGMDLFNEAISEYVLVESRNLAMLYTNLVINIVQVS